MDDFVISQVLESRIEGSGKRGMVSSHKAPLISTAFDPSTFLRWGNGDNSNNAAPKDPHIEAIKKRLKQRIMEISFSPAFKQITYSIAENVLIDSQGCYKPWNTEGIVILSEGMLASDESTWHHACIAALVEILKISPARYYGPFLTPAEHGVISNIGWKQTDTFQTDAKTVFIIQSPDPHIWETIVRENWGLWSLSALSIVGQCPDFSEPDFAVEYPYLSRIVPFMTQKRLCKPSRSNNMISSGTSAIDSSKFMNSAGATSYLSSFQLFQFPIAFLHQIDLEFWKS